MDIDFVERILKNAQDISLNSPELARSWVNGLTEYHLNPDRANILRPLQLGQELNVLEVGCSSGILSRYLGEQGHRVIGITTCQDSLNVAKLRCADMSKVSFATDAKRIAAALSQHYDLIVLVSPLPKLLARFLGPDADNNAAQELTACLHLLKDCLAENGMLVIAAGNRLGLKYWLGATEEHSNQPYLGLWGYGSAAHSPRLFCRTEWLDIIQQAALPHYRFLYPFPDHLFPDLIISEDFISSDPNAHSLLYRLRSRDISAPEWRPNQDEFLYWKSLHQAKYLQDFTNSFLIILSKEQNALEKVFPYDFIRLTKSWQKNDYHTVTYKEKQHDIVVKQQIGKHSRAGQDKIEKIGHRPSSNDYLQGPLLAELWIDALVLGNHETDYFKRLLHEYYRFLTNKLEQASQLGQYLDLLPFNIILDAAGNYQSFDQEWTIDCAEIRAEFIFFRALLWFGFAHDTHISSCMADKNLTTLDEFIKFCFQLLSLDYEKLLPSFIALEGKVQHSIDPKQGPDQIRALLYQPFQQAIRTYQITLFKTEMFWVTETKPLSAANSMSVQAHIDKNIQTLFFTLPDNINDLKILRFDPGEQPGFIHLHRLTLRQSSKNTTEEGQILWQAVGSRAIAEATILENLHYCPSALGDVFLALDEDPHVIIELPESVTEQSGAGNLLFEAVVDWPQSADYLAVLDEMRTQRRLLREERANSRLRLEQIEQVQENAAVMRQRIAVLEHKLDAVRRTWIGRMLRKLKVSPFQF